MFVIKEEIADRKTKTSWSLSVTLVKRVYFRVKLDIKSMVDSLEPQANISELHFFNHFNLQQD